MAKAATLHEFAPAKINLALHVLGRRDDGYHDLESLVAFADIGDRLTLIPGDHLSLTVTGPIAPRLAQDSDNLVLKAVRALMTRKPGLRTGAFTLEKNLPIASGIGGGSADAAAALRLVARANGLSLSDPDVQATALATGADVPVCLEGKARIMRGVGELLDQPMILPKIDAVLINPGIGVSTPTVFQKLGLEKGQLSQSKSMQSASTLRGVDDVIALLKTLRNEFETPAIAIAPVIRDMLGALSMTLGCRLARMSGSGATVFGIFPDTATAQNAAVCLAENHPHWWITTSHLS